MAEHQKLLRVQTHSGEPVTIGNVTITPQAQALSLRWPNGGFVWNRPVAILVEGGAERERIPIVDVTLVAQVALLGLTVGSFFVGVVLSALSRRK
jgi:hypothetical protein